MGGGEGDEGDEAGEYDREGEALPVRCLLRQQGQDGDRFDEERFDEELVREDRQQEGERGRQEALQPHPGLDPVVVEGPEGAELEGLRGSERQERPGQSLVREGEVFLLAVSRRPVDKAQHTGAFFGQEARSGVWGSPAPCLSDKLFRGPVRSVYTHTQK